MDYQLDGVAVVTGGASGIGQGTVFTFAEIGVRAIVVADIDLQRAQATAEKSEQVATNPKYRAFPISVDVADPISVQNMVEIAIKEFEMIDYYVHSAGIDVPSYGPITDSSAEDFDRVMTINAKGVFLCLRAVAKAMQAQEPRSVQIRNRTKDIGRGSIVVIASANSYAPVPGKVAYISSKFATMGIVKSAALENATLGVRINAVCPTWVRTPMFETECKKLPTTPDIVKAVCPLGRAAEPEEVADVISFLCSPGATYVTGTGLLVDGGMTLTVHMG